MYVVSDQVMGCSLCRSSRFPIGKYGITRIGPGVSQNPTICTVKTFEFQFPSASKERICLLTCGLLIMIRTSLRIISNHFARCFSLLALFFLTLARRSTYAHMRSLCSHRQPSQPHQTLRSQAFTCVPVHISSVVVRCKSALHLDMPRLIRMTPRGHTELAQMSTQRTDDKQ